MEQKLILPFKRSVLSAAYKHSRYRACHGYAHYGWDMGCDESGDAVLASGTGIVVAAGLDGSCPRGAGANLGNCIVVVYEDVRLPGVTVQDVACRMFHMDSISVRVGQTVRAGTKLGDYGDTGRGPWSKHLHIEFDSDTRIVGGCNYAVYAVGIAQSGKVIKRGSVDSTIDPAKVFHMADGQSIRGCPGDDGRDWYSTDDIMLPRATARAVFPACGREL